MVTVLDIIPGVLPWTVVVQFGVHGYSPRYYTRGGGLVYRVDV